ncbi:MAG: phage Gp37/Gp68 family protein [bacterium]|nr:phage Gp37/Gp68 family protein [bacterium]
MSRIEWTDETWNPIRAMRRDSGRMGWHCRKVSAGCANCYAERWNGRGLQTLGTKLPYAQASESRLRIGLHEPTLSAPLRWKKSRMIFVCSMTDLFGEWVPFEIIREVFNIMLRSPLHTFQVLTKRPARMVEAIDRYLREQDGVGSPPGTVRLLNVWCGASVENQATCDERIRHVLRCPSAVRFLSIEPMLGSIRIPQSALRNLHWVIVGGESGPGARPMHPDWARSIRDQCAAAGVPFFFKQWGAWAPTDDDDERFSGAAWVHVRSEDGAQGEPSGRHGPQVLDAHGELTPNGNIACVSRLGKKRAGRVLDGRLHDAMPNAERQRGNEATRQTATLNSLL